MAFNKLNDKGEGNTQKKDKRKVAIVTIFIALAVAISGLVGYRIGRQPFSTIPIDEAVGFGDVAARPVSSEEKTNLLGKMQEGINEFRSKYLYLTVQDGEDTYVAMLYNPSREVFAQGSETGYTTVYFGDNMAVRYTDYVNYGADSDMFSLVESAYNMAVDGKATLLTCTDDSIVDGYDQLIIDINGWDSISELYSYVSEEYGEMMIDQLKSGIVEASASEDSGIDEDDELNFRFAIALNSETSMPDAVTCYAYFGDIAPEQVTWNDLGASWSYNGYSEVYEWSLLDDWNNLDWATLEDWDSVEPAEEVLLNQSEILIDMMGKVQEDESDEIISDESSSGEQTETSESGTEYSSSPEDGTSSNSDAE